ncbi:MAG: hypothetical protein R6V44_00130 [Paracoccaceae bacterium]
MTEVRPGRAAARALRVFAGAEPCAPSSKDDVIGVERAVGDLRLDAEIRLADDAEMHAGAGDAALLDRAELDRLAGRLWSRRGG